LKITTTFFGHRLLAIGKADDAQPPRRQSDSRSEKEPFFIRTAVHDGTSHRAHDFLRHGSLLGQIDDACDAAHDFPLLRTSPVWRPVSSLISWRLFPPASRFAASHQRTEPGSFDKIRPAA
jgi:hypothetical protein